jgi:multiple sugar transport system substrate-binding protein
MRFASVVTAVFLCLQWSGCREAPKAGVGDLAGRDLDTIDPAGQTVRFWYQHTRQREDELLRMIAEFNQKNPHGIEVIGEYAGNYGNIYNKMLVALQGGIPPSLVVAYQNQALAYYEADGVVDLNPYIESEKWGLTTLEREDLVAAFMDQDRIDGVQVGFPPNRSLETLYYNLDWLTEMGFAGPPQSWEAFAEMCRKAVVLPFSKATNKKNCLGFYIEADASRLASMVFSRGGDLINADRTAYTLDTPAARASLTLISELVADGAVQLLGEDYGDQTAFFLGEVLFVLRSTSGLPNFRQGIEEAGGEFEWSITALPHGEDPPVVNVYGASVSICRTTPAQQLATWLFVRWFIEPEQQARWVRASNYFPARKSAAARLSDYFSANKHYKKAYALLEHGRSEPAMAGYQQVRRLIADAIVEVVDGGDVQSVLTHLERRANDTLTDY